MQSVAFQWLEQAPIANRMSRDSGTNLLLSVEASEPDIQQREHYIPERIDLDHVHDNGDVGLAHHLLDQLPGLWTVLTQSTLIRFILALDLLSVQPPPSGPKQDEQSRQRELVSETNRSVQNPTVSQVHRVRERSRSKDAIARSLKQFRAQLEKAIAQDAKAERAEPRIERYPQREER